MSVKKAADLVMAIVAHPGVRFCYESSFFVAAGTGAVASSFYVIDRRGNKNASSDALEEQKLLRLAVEAGNRVESDALEERKLLRLAVEDSNRILSRIHEEMKLNRITTEERKAKRGRGWGWR